MDSATLRDLRRHQRPGDDDAMGEAWLALPRHDPGRASLATFLDRHVRMLDAREARRRAIHARHAGRIAMRMGCRGSERPLDGLVDREDAAEASRLLSIQRDALALRLAVERGNAGEAAKAVGAGVTRVRMTLATVRRSMLLMDGG